MNIHIHTHTHTHFDLYYINVCILGTGAIKRRRTGMKPKTALTILYDKIPLLEYKIKETGSGYTATAQVCTIKVLNIVKVKNVHELV